MTVISQRRYAIASILIVCLALWLRLTQLYTLPLFSDEADHLFWSQQFYLGQVNYPFLMDGKFLMGVLVAQFQPIGPDPLWVGRAVIGLFSILSVAASIYLGRQLGSRPAGLLAGLFYAVLPHAIQHERQLLADPLMAAFGAIAIALTWRVTKERSWLAVVGLGAAIALAFLSKVFGLLYFAYPAAAGLFVLLSKDGKRTTRINWPGAKPAVLRLTLAIGLAGVFMGGFLLALRPRLGYDTFTAITSSQIGYVHCPRLICQASPAAQLQDLQEALPVLADTLGIYISWPLVVLALLALPLARHNYKRPTLWLFASGLLTFFAWLTATGVFPPRYLSFVLVPVVVLGVGALVNGVERLRARFRSPPPVWGVAWGAAVTALVLTFQPMTNTVWLIARPYEAAMPDLDKSMFQGNFRAGFQEATRYIVAQEAPDTRVYILASNKFERTLMAYLDRERFTVERDTLADMVSVGQRLLEGQPVYYVDVVDKGATPVPYLPFTAVELARYFYTTEADVRLNRVISADAAMRDILFRRFFTLPKEIENHYADLVNALPTNTPIRLLVYPPNHTEVVTHLVTERETNVTVIPIGNAWPLEATGLNDELAQAVIGSSDVRVVFDQETKGDPNRLIETWFNTHLYRIDEQWFTPVRVLRYAPDGPVTETIPATVRFGDSIQLERIDVLDSSATAGGVVRIRLNWQALASTNQQFKVFVHIFSGDRIIAQRDGQPVGELRPTNTWQTGEIIADPFAISLPADAPPGTYQLRVGLYDIATQERLQVTNADGTASEFFTGGTIVVE